MAINTKIKIDLLQLESNVGNINYNKDKIINLYKNSSADLILTAEGFLTSYMIADYIFDTALQSQLQSAIQEITQITDNRILLLCTPYTEQGKIYNCCLVLQNKKILQIIHKSKLPNYGIFNENRHFTAKSNTNNILTIQDTKIAILICEDVWQKDKVQQCCEQNPQLMISLNASPFELEKHKNRLKALSDAQSILDIPHIYLNTVECVDDIIFDGSSIILNPNQELVSVLNHCEEDCTQCVFENNLLTVKSPKYYEKDELSLVYNALIRGTREFITKSGFTGALIGISGGIDSTLTAAIAADALGSENILGISMPSKYTSQESFDVINQLKKQLNIKITEISIDSLYESYQSTLSNHANLSSNNAGENLQARIRGTLLMSFANQNSKHMLLTTGNKSEIATGYCTLYGDTCGFFNILKDLYKTQVFALSKWRNNNIPKLSKEKIVSPIPDLAITRKPSAELKENQYDENHLMDYSILDDILYHAIEKNMSKKDLCNKFDATLVEKAYNLLHNSQFKRIQSAIGLKISTRPFYKDFCYPLTKQIKY